MIKETHGSGTRARKKDYNAHVCARAEAAGNDLEDQTIDVNAATVEAKRGSDAEKTLTILDPSDSVKQRG